MAKENQKIYFLALFMVLCAILLRVLGKLGILDVPLGVIRSLLYITLYIGWGIFAYRKPPTRIQNNSRLHKKSAYRPILLRRKTQKQADGNRLSAPEAAKVS